MNNLLKIECRIQVSHVEYRYRGITFVFRRKKMVYSKNHFREGCCGLKDLTHDMSKLFVKLHINF